MRRLPVLAPWHARALMANGLTAEARAVVDAGLRALTTDAQRQALDTLRAELDRKS